MLSTESIFEELLKFFFAKTVVSISGSSGTGKTTLALQFVSKLLTRAEPYEDSCVWVQASELFSKKRLRSLFEHLDVLDYLESNIFAIPKSTIKSYEEQSSVLYTISRDISQLPPFTKIIVIDNISNHLRHQISQSSDKKQVISILNNFFETQLEPLIFFCQRKAICLILLHEVSFNPELERNVPFFHSLYERIDSLHIHLEKDIFQKQNTLQATLNNSCINLEYKLRTKGLEFFS